MITEWEQAAPDEWPVTFYLCYDSSLATYKTRHKAVKQQNNDMFSELATDTTDTDVPTGERAYYRMRLPYTDVMLERRRERLGN